MRYFIGHFLKDTNVLEDISQQNEFHHFTIDESDFTKIDDSIIRVICLINTHIKLNRLKISFYRDAEIMKKIMDDSSKLTQRFDVINYIRNIG